MSEKRNYEKKNDFTSYLSEKLKNEDIKAQYDSLEEEYQKLIEKQKKEKSN